MTNSTLQLLTWIISVGDSWTMEFSNLKNFCFVYRSRKRIDLLYYPSLQAINLIARTWIDDYDSFGTL